MMCEAHTVMDLLPPVDHIERVWLPHRIRHDTDTGYRKKLFGWLRKQRGDRMEAPRHHAVAGLWTAEENKQFERALAGLDLCRPDWEKVARAIPGRTVREVVSHFNNLQLQVNVQEIKSGLVPLPVDGGGASSFTLQWDGNGGYGPGDFRHGPRGRQWRKRHHGRTPEQERKKGVPWTEEEHKPCLAGLQLRGSSGGGAASARPPEEPKPFCTYGRSGSGSRNGAPRTEPGQTRP